MTERRPSLKRLGITMTGRQWRTVEALQADGWLVLEADPTRWSDAEVERVRSALADREEWERAECTGLTATWCPVHGDCTCTRHEDGEVYFGTRGICPLHADDSTHAETDARFDSTEQDRRDFEGRMP